jgi:hypothetical protein
VRERRFKPPSRVEWLIIALIISFSAFFLWPITRGLSGPRGDAIPVQPPDEANRAHDPDGFSMVVPLNWSHNLIGGLHMAPMQPGPGRRSKALLHVQKIGPDPPSHCEGLQRTLFQGRQAFEQMAIVRRSTFDDPAWSEYVLDFRRGEDWYEITYGIAEERAVLPAMIQRYINTFSLEENRPGPGAGPNPPPP